MSPLTQLGERKLACGAPIMTGVHTRIQPSNAANLFTFLMSRVIYHSLGFYLNFHYLFLCIHYSVENFLIRWKIDREIVGVGSFFQGFVGWVLRLPRLIPIFCSNRGSNKFAFNWSYLSVSFECFLFDIKKTVQGNVFRWHRLGTLL